MEDRRLAELIKTGGLLFIQTFASQMLNRNVIKLHNNTRSLVPSVSEGYELKAGLKWFEW